MPKFKPARSSRYALWDKWGFFNFEATEFSRQYSVKDMRSLPYLTKMARWRRLYGTNLASKGYGAEEIARSVQALYHKKGWITPDGSLDPWAMLRSFRKAIIASGGDPSPGFAPTRRSHHSRKEITQAELNRQAKQLSIQRNIDKDIWGR